MRALGIGRGAAKVRETLVDGKMELDLVKLLAPRIVQLMQKSEGETKPYWLAEDNMISLDVDPATFDNTKVAVWSNFDKLPSS